MPGPQASSPDSTGSSRSEKTPRRPSVTCSGMGSAAASVSRSASSSRSPESVKRARRSSVPSVGSPIGGQSGRHAARYTQSADRAPARSNEESTMTAAPTTVERPTHSESSARRASATVARLVHAAASGDHGACEALVDEFGGLVWAVARAHRLSAADAADVAGATWLRLVAHLDNLREADRVGAWLATTARRECLRVLRHGQRQMPAGDDVDPQPSEPTDIAAELMTAERDVAGGERSAACPSATGHSCGYSS